MRIVTILGTSRPDNFTGKALALVNDELGKQSRVEVDAIDAGELNLLFPGQSGDTTDKTRLTEAVKAATGVVLATPEYHGTFAAMMKLIIENLGFPSVLAGKPVALLGTAAGRIGAIKSLEQLRGVCSHVGAIVLPGPVSVANVQRVFDKDGKCLDAGVEKAVRGLATTLLHYIHNNICPKVALETMVRGDAVVPLSGQP